MPATWMRTPLGGVEPVGGAHEPRRAGDHLVRDQPVADDPGRAVDVGQERLEGADPLGDPLGDLRPLAGREDAGHHVEGEGSLFTVEVEGHALVHEGPGEPGGPGRDVVGSHLGQRGRHPGIGRPGRPVAADHLVEGGLGQATGRPPRSHRTDRPHPSRLQPCVSQGFHGRERSMTPTGPGRDARTEITSMRPSSLHVIALAEQLLGGHGDALPGEVVVLEVLGHRPVPLAVGETGKPNWSPSGAPYSPELATATEVQSPGAVLVRRRDHRVDGGRRRPRRPRTGRAPR